MPNCIIEYSAPIIKQATEQQLMEVVFSAALDSKLFVEESIKCRTRRYEYFLSKGAPSYFIHVVLHILSGRSSEEKSILSAKVLHSLLDIGITDAVISVQVSDMDKECFSKVQV